MPEQSAKLRPNLSWPMLINIGCLMLALAAIGWPDAAWAVSVYVAKSLVSVAPLVIPGILLAAWITASGASDGIATAFNGRIVHTVLIASAIGAVTPVCGVTVLPLMAGLLASGVPLAPIMAFWLSSPITDPAMLAATAATLGISFAVGKTLAAFFLGIFGGLITAWFSDRPWYREALRKNSLVGRIGAGSCGASLSFDYAVWNSSERRARFARESWSITRLILLCLIPAFAAEYALNAVLHPGALASYLGADQWWSVPVAVFVGAPAYLDGYAALPLTRSLIDHGMSPGAALAFLVSGGVVSIWGAMAIFPVLKVRPFLLYLALAVVGSLATGWIFDLLV